MMSARKAQTPLLMKLLKVGLNVLLSIRRALNMASIAAGGKAVAAICSAEDGEKIVDIAIKKFGGVHVLIANAGILRDKSFTSMTEQEWDMVVAVHLRGTYKVKLASCCLVHD